MPPIRYTREDKVDTSIQEKVKSDFLHGEINAEEFRDAWLDLDQKGTHVENAAQNIHVFEDKEIKRKIEEYGSDAIAVYNGMLSLSYFHKAQDNPNEDDFRKAYEYALQDSRYQSWIDYARGTLAYFEKDRGTLSSILGVIQGPEVNIKILKRLLISLKKGDDPKEKYLDVYTNMEERNSVEIAEVPKISFKSEREDMNS